MSSTSSFPETSRAPMGVAKGSILFGLAVVVLAFGGVGTWAALAPLDSAAVAPGEIVVKSNRKTVQHLEGGIIGQLLVKEGDRVEANDILIKLDDTRARASLSLVTGQYQAALAREARLIAERDEAATIKFARELIDGARDPAVQDLMQGQVNVFEARRQSLEGQQAVLRRRVEQYKEEIVGLQALERAQKRQLDLIAEETASVKDLVERGMERKPRLLALQRAWADLEGSRGENIAQIARAKQNIAGTELEIIQLRRARLDQVTTDLHEAQTQINDFRERMLAAADVLKRIDIRAPQGGIVVGLKFHTPGGVIQAGEAIMDLVPQKEMLIVEARIRPDDIDDVHPGLPAQVRLTAFKQRITPAVEGTVALVSADRLTDQRTGEPYFKAQVELDPASLSSLPKTGLYPGMPADVIIITGKRTALEYMISPFTDALQHAFREH
jgi:HlyD family secretion protein